MTEPKTHRTRTAGFSRSPDRSHFRPIARPSRVRRRSHHSVSVAVTP